MSHGSEIFRSARESNLSLSDIHNLTCDELRNAPDGPRCEASVCPSARLKSIDAQSFGVVLVCPGSGYSDK